MANNKKTPLMEEWEVSKPQMARFRNFLKNEPMMAILTRNLSFLLDKGKRIQSVEINDGLESYTDGKKVVISGLPMFINEDFDNKSWAAMMRVTQAHEIQHDNSSDFKVLERIQKDFAKHMEKNYGIHEAVSKQIMQGVLNCAEDGRINDIIVQRFPGYFGPMRWQNIAIRNANRVLRMCETPEEELSVFMTEILCFCKTGLDFPGASLYKGHRVEQEFLSIRDMLDDAVNAATAKECGDLCLKAMKTVSDYIAELVKNQSDITKLMEKFIDHMYSQSEDTREESGKSKSSSSGGGSGISIRVPRKGGQKGQGGQSGGKNSDQQGQDNGESNSSGQKSDQKTGQKAGKSSGKNSGKNSGKDSGNGNETGKNEKKDDESYSATYQMDGGEEKKDSGSSNGSDGSKDSNEESGKESGKDSDGSKGNNGAQNSGDTNGSGKNGGSQDSNDNASPRKVNSIDDVIQSGFSESDAKLSDEEVQAILDAADKELRTTKAHMAATRVERGRATPLSGDDMKTLKSKYGNVELNEVFPEPLKKPLPQTILTPAKALHDKLETILVKKKVAASGYKKGFLYPPHLYRVGFNSQDIFRRQDPPKLSDCVVYELIDGSGSMSDTAYSGVNKIQAAITTAAIMEEALKGLAATKISVFSAGWHSSVKHIVLKDFDQAPHGNRCYDALATTPPSGGNMDGYSIRVAAMDLVKRKEKNKILLVLSDGLPSAYASSKEAKADVRSAVKWARNHGIIVVSIMFGEPNFLKNNLPDYKDMYEQDIIACRPANINHEFEVLLSKLVK